MLKGALEIEEKHVGSNHSEVAKVLVNLGNAYDSLGDTKKAKELLERAYQIFLIHPNAGPNHLNRIFQLSKIYFQSNIHNPLFSVNKNTR